MPRIPLCLALSLIAHAGLAWLLHDVRAEPAIAQGKVPAEVVHLVALAEPAPPVAEPVVRPAPVPAVAKAEPPRQPAEARPVAVKPRLVSPKAPARQAARSEPAPQPQVQPRSTREPALAKAAPSATPQAAPSQPLAARLPKAEVVSDQPSFLSPPKPPIYPAQARRRNQQGVVLVEVRLDERGALRDMKLLRSSGIESLDEAAMNAVANWRFRPEVQDGEPVPSRVTIPIEFALTASR